MSNAQQIATAANTATSHVINVTAYHKEVFAAALAGRKASETMLTKMQRLIESKYGKTAPTYEQFRADRAALRSLATDKGLVDDQWIRKPYNLAMKAVFGALPEAQTAGAIARRKVREAQAATSTARPGAVAGQTAPRRTSNAETLEQYMTRVGVFKVLQACAAILEADDTTKSVAATLKALKAA